MNKPTYIRTLTVSLLFGMMICGFVGIWLGLREAKKLMVDGTESSDALSTIYAVHAIESIQSGDTQNAVRILSQPIAHYYNAYEYDGGTGKRHELRVMIERLISSNRVVATEVKEMKAIYDDSPLKKP